MENKSHALAAGAFVLFVSVLAIALAAWLARDNRIGDVYEFSTRESVTGLTPQATVRYRGVAVGKVDTIEFDSKIKGNVLVRMLINTNTPVTKNTYAMLGFQGVTGLAYVQLDDDGKSSEALPTSTSEPARLPLRQSLLNQLTDQGTAVLVQAEETTRRVNQLLSADNQKILLGAMQSTGQSAEKLGAMSQRVQKIMDAQFGPERTDIPKLVKETTETMRTLQISAAQINKTAQEATRAAQAVTQLGAKITAQDGVLDQVSNTLVHANAAIAQVGQSGAALAQSAQTLNANTLPRAARAADDAAKTARNIDRAVDNLADNPQSLVFGNGANTAGPGEPGFVAPPPSTAR